MKLTVFKHGKRNFNKIAFTFDDGPNPYWTEKVLDLLKEKNVKANFFVLGKYVEKHPDIVKRAFDEGHLIGNHTYSHPKIETGNERGDFEKAEKIISTIIGRNTECIRPPHFHTKLCLDYAPAVNGSVKIIEGDKQEISYDWQETKENIVAIITERTQNGSIILLHDGSHREDELEKRPAEMFKALPNIIDELKKKGFQFVRLDEMEFD